jgi:hypothetical protein
MQIRHILIKDHISSETTEGGDHFSRFMLIMQIRHILIKDHIRTYFSEHRTKFNQTWLVDGPISKLFPTTHPPFKMVLLLSIELLNSTLRLYFKSK